MEENDAELGFELTADMAEELSDNKGEDENE